MSQALQSVVRIWIDGIEVVEATDFDIQSPQPAGQKFGARGLIGTFFGQAGSRLSLTFATSAIRSQFETIVKANPQLPKVIVFSKGTSRFMMRDAFYTDSGFRGAYESGDNTYTVSVLGGPIEQVA